MYQNVEYEGITLTERNDGRIRTHTYVCRDRRHLSLVPEDERLRNDVEKREWEILQKGNCPKCEWPAP